MGKVLKMMVLGILLTGGGFLASCNDGAPESGNPLLATWNTPYGLPDFASFEVNQYLPAFQEGIDQQMAQIGL